MRIRVDLAHEKAVDVPELKLVQTQHFPTQNRTGMSFVQFHWAIFYLRRFLGDDSRILAAANRSARFSTQDLPRNHAPQNSNDPKIMHLETRTTHNSTRNQRLKPLVSCPLGLLATADRHG